MSRRGSSATTLPAAAARPVAEPLAGTPLVVRGTYEEVSRIPRPRKSPVTPRSTG
jgi:hypothetical protein